MLLVAAACEIIGAMGCSHSSELRPTHLMKRIDEVTVASLNASRQAARQAVNTGGRSRRPGLFASATVASCLTAATTAGLPAPSSPRAEGRAHTHFGVGGRREAACCTYTETKSEDGGDDGALLGTARE